MSPEADPSNIPFFKADPRSTALIVIDMQNAFVDEGAAFETPPARAMIPLLERLIQFARAQKMPVIWTQSDHRPPYGGLMLRKFDAIGKRHAIWSGDPSFEMYPHMLQPQEGPGEYRIVKHKYDSFFETGLDAILRYHKIETVVITGTATNVCCESTARAAFMRDYQVLFPRDTNATFDEAMHEATLRNIEMFFGRVLSTQEVLDELEQARNDKSSTARSASQSPSS